MNLRSLVLMSAVATTVAACGGTAQPATDATSLHASSSGGAQVADPTYPDKVVDIAAASTFASNKLPDAPSETASK